MPPTPLNWHPGTDTERLPVFMDQAQEPIPTWQEFRKTGRASAVAVLFDVSASSRDQASAPLVLTRRSLKVNSHKGQISLPGGRREDHDITPADTARREASEELGVPREALVAHGILPTLPALNRDLVVPVLVTSTERPHPDQVQTDEVAELLAIPWEFFRADRRELVHFRLFGLQRRSYLYRQPPHLIWGLTAQILALANFDC